MFYFLNTCRLPIIFLLSSKRDDFSRLRIFDVIGSFLQQNFLRKVKKIKKWILALWLMSMK